MYNYHNDLAVAHAAKLAVVGVAVQPEAGLVLSGRLTRMTTAASIYDAGKHGHLVARHPRDGVRRVPGVPTPQASRWP